MSIAFAALILGGFGAPAEHLGCIVTSAYVDHLISRRGLGPIVFSVRPERWPASLYRLTWTGPSGNDPGPRPPTALLRAFGRSAGTSAIRLCPSLRSALDLRHIAHGETAYLAALDHPGTTKHAAYIVGVSRAVLSRDGKEALLSTSGYSSYDAGGAGIIYLRRDRDLWRVVAMADTMMT